MKWNVKILPEDNSFVFYLTFAILPVEYEDKLVWLEKCVKVKKWQAPLTIYCRPRYWNNVTRYHTYAEAFEGFYKRT